MQIFAGFLHMTSICAGYQMNGVHTLTPGILLVSLIPILTQKCPINFSLTAVAIGF